MSDTDFTLLSEKNVVQRVEDRIDSQASNARNAPGEVARSLLPRVSDRNIGAGIAIGVIEATIAIVLKDTIGIPVQSDVEIVDTAANPDGDGVIYTVNVDAPFENMARAEAFFDSTVGFTSLLTDSLNVTDVQVLKKRVLRDTYQVKILVED